jgi:hypothetical protein
LALVRRKRIDALTSLNRTRKDALAVGVFILTFDPPLPQPKGKHRDNVDH